jgi:hypothetical protein
MSHEVGDDFTLLDLDTIDTITYDGAAIGLPWKYAFLNGVGHIDLTLTGRRIRPNPASHAAITHDFSTGDATIAWVPRRRLRYEIQDGIDPGVDEPVEDYAVDILLNAIPVRTITSWSGVTAVVGGRAGVDTGWRTVSYPVADQLADGVSGDFEAVIYQISDRVGRGVGCSVSSSDFTWNGHNIEAGSAVDAPAISSLTWAASTDAAASAADRVSSTGDLTEEATADDAVSSTLVWGVSVTEAATAIDITDWRGNVDEIAFADAYASVTVEWNVGITASASAADAPTWTGAWAASLTEAATATSSATTFYPPVWAVGVTEAVTATVQTSP